MMTKHWRRFAACGGRDDLEWIDPTPADETTCRAVCAGCPVLAQCMDAALAHGEPWGIWAGLNSAERAQLAACSGVPRPRVLPPHGTNARYAKHGCRCDICRDAHTVYERRRRNRCNQPGTRRPPR